MKKMMTIVEARKLFGEACYETETGFLVNVFGKYRPNITFIISKEFDLDADGKPVNPLRYVSDREVTDSMNMNFDGDAEFMFGDFWVSKKGGACFRPKNPRVAKDLLVRVSWGGCFNSHRGTYSDEAKAIEGIKYFRRASSNGGKAGNDFWVVPVGFARILHIDEIDGETTVDHTAEFERRAKAYREKHSRLQRETSEANDKAYKAKLAAEEESRRCKASLLPRLTEIQAELAELHRPKKYGRYGVDELTFGEEYFKVGYHQYLYDEESLAKAEAYLVRTRDWIADEETKKAAKAEARATFEPEFEKLRDQIERIGWRLSFGEERALVKDPAKVRDTYHCRDNGITSYPFNLDGVTKLREDIREEADRIAEEDMRTRNAERISNLLADTELPENLWFLFEGSEDMDSMIRKEVEAIMAAATSEKDAMDSHELRNCGFGRRCSAIRRVLKRNGGNIDNLNVNSQAGSKELAWFIAG